MSNHGVDNDALPEELRKQLKGLFEKTMPGREDLERLVFPDRDQLGATGRFPMGKLTPDDEGEFRFAVAADPKTQTIILDFGKPVVWIAFPRQDALALIETLQQKIAELSE